MKILVTYKSKTDFTKRYAEIIAADASADLADFKEVTAEKMSEYDVVVYGGGLYAGMINGYKKAKEEFSKSTAKKFVLFATGGTPNNDTAKIDEVWKMNLGDEQQSIPYFYMQAGLCYEKMSFFSRLIMKMMSGILSKNQNTDAPAGEVANTLKHSYDISSPEYAEPLVQYLLEEAKKQSEE